MPPVSSTKELLLWSLSIKGTAKELPLASFAKGRLNSSNGESLVRVVLSFSFNEA